MRAFPRAFPVHFPEIFFRLTTLRPLPYNQSIKKNHPAKRFLIFELRKKGISTDLIQSAVEDVDDFQSAYDLAESRLFRYERLPQMEFRRKLGNYLAEKGYSFDVISAITQDLWKKINTSTMEDLD